MIQIKRILFPTDFSPCADQALDHALHLAARYGATLHMLHAIVLHEDDPHHPSAHFTDIDEIHQRLRDLARIEMKAALSERADARGDVLMRQRRGFSAADVILDYSDSESIDLIVMGTHGRGGLGRLLLGSAAERVVRCASCPVLTIRERETPGSVKAVNRLLVPIDFSEHAMNLISHSKEIAATQGAKLELLHVIDEIPSPGFYGDVGFSLDASELGLELKARREMRRMYDSSAGPDVDMRINTAVGRAGEGIVDFAEEKNVDLIVIATHGLSGIQRLLIGSVAEKVVRLAPCPVLTVKSIGKSLIGESENLRSAGWPMNPVNLGQVANEERGRARSERALVQRERATDC